eukprot:13161989-Alexandrium_andersonii.AAC.1
MCLATHAVRTPRAAVLSRHATSCPAATQVPSPTSRTLRPQRHRDTGSLRLSSSNPTARTLPTADSLSSPNQR